VDSIQNYSNQLSVWSQTWRTLASDIDQSSLGSAKVKKDKLKPDLEKILFFEQLDDAFRLLEPLTKNSDQHASVLNNLTNEYFLARHKSDQASFQRAEAFDTLVPMLKHYKERSLNPQIFDRLTNIFLDKKKGKEVQDIYSSALENYIIPPLFEEFNYDIVQLGQHLKKLPYWKIYNRLYDSFDSRFKDASPIARVTAGRRLLELNKAVLSLDKHDIKLWQTMERISNNSLFYRDDAKYLHWLAKEDLLETFSKLNTEDVQRIISFLPLRVNDKNYVWNALNGKNEDDHLSDFSFALENIIYNNDELDLVLHSYLDIAEAFAIYGWDNKVLTELFSKITDYALPEYETQLRNYAEALCDKEFLQTEEDALGRLGDILVSLEIRYRNKPGNYGQANDISLINMDQVPWPSSNFIQMDNAKAQAKETLKNVDDRFRSSLAYAYANRKVKVDGKSSFAEFLDWLKPDFLNPQVNEGWKDHQFPGNGYCFSGLNLSPEIKDYVVKVTGSWDLINIYSKEYDKEFLEQRSKTILSDLEEAEIIRLRGITVVEPGLNSQDYILESSWGLEPYSFVFYNDHYANPTNTRVLLVPSRVIQNNKIKEDFVKNLRPEVLRLDDDVIDLGSMSIFGGGLSNGRKPRSYPMFTWQESNNYYPDLNGHPHKWNISDNFGLLKKLQKDHLKIYDIQDRFFTMLHQLDLLESMHTKGVQNEPGEEIGFNLETVLNKFQDWQDFYQFNEEENEQFEAVLVDCDTFNPGQRPNWTVRLDAKRNQYSYRDSDGNVETYPLSFDIGDRSELLYHRITPKSSETNLRFYPRYLKE
jgi:hypothetical protein